jgi:SHS2 domain-containing protein
MYTTFAHTADTGLRVEAPDLDTLFAEAAQALFSLIVSNPDDIETPTSRQFTLQGSQFDYLLVDWLSELLFTFESERLLFRDFHVSVHRDGLSAKAAGEVIDENRHRLGCEVKAITYHGLKVEQTEEQWIANVIVDI